MNTRTLASVVLGMSLVVVGCEQSDSGTTPTGSSPAAAPTAATPAAPSASEAPTAAAPAAPSAAETPSAAAPAVPATPAAPAAAATPADAAATAAGTAAATTQPVAPAEVQKMLDQAVTYVKENKMELADKTLTQLESMKAQIPVEYHPKIDQARKAFTAAKAGGGNLGGLLPGAK